MKKQKPYPVERRQMMLKKIVLLCFLFGIVPVSVFAKENGEGSIYAERMALYRKTEAVTQIPWYYLAAIDQYERNIHKTDDQIVSIRIPDEIWYGAGNLKHKNVRLIGLFGGAGKDGNGDGIADPDTAEDALFTMASLLLNEGSSEDDIKIALWKYYQRDLSVKSIASTARVFKQFKQVDLLDRTFPVSIRHNYSYRSTWGGARGFGGRRIHEGTDIFAAYGVPVLSTTYGVVELKGWNLYGGWRIGVRDIHNIYHYYAHLNSFNRDMKVGDVVKPGDLLGTVGATGYGPPGTSGKFPPHLHYGMYKDNGRNEWSFDPYPYLRKWERMAKQTK